MIAYQKLGKKGNKAYYQPAGEGKAKGGEGKTNMQV